MAEKKTRRSKLPLSISGIRDASGSVDEQSTRALSLSIFVDSSCSAELIARAKEQFRPQVETLQLDVTFFETVAPCVDDRTTLLVLLAAESTVVGEALAYAKRHNVAAVVLTLHPKQAQLLAQAAEFPLDALEIVGPDPQLTGEQERLVSAFDALGIWIVRNLGDQRLAFARALPFVRRPLAHEITRSTAYQNAVIAAVFFPPGADMPLLTLNQARMMLQIAGAFDLPVGTERIKELAVLLASAFGFRALARKLVGLVPVIGWAIRGAVGYSATMALGYAATEFFAQGGDVKQLARHIQDAAPEIRADIAARIPASHTPPQQESE